MVKNETCDGCKWYRKKWLQEDGTKNSCRKLGYNIVCAEWTPKVEKDIVASLDVQEPNWDGLFLEVLLDGFRKQAGLDRILRSIKQHLADNGFDVDFDEKKFSALAQKMIGITQIRALCYGLGLATYEDKIVGLMIDSLLASDVAKRRSE
jgi:hypothetical protein